MSFADPQSVTINSVANSLPRTSVGVNTSSYTKDDGTIKLSASHQYGKRTRRTLRLDHSKIAPDPFVSSQNVSRGMSVYTVIDMPTDGYTNAEAKLVIDGYTAKLTASSGAIITSLLGGEN